MPAVRPGRAFRPPRAPQSLPWLSESSVLRNLSVSLFFSMLRSFRLWKLGSFPSLPCSVAPDHKPTIHGNNLTCQISRGVGREERNDIRNVIRQANAAKWNDIAHCFGPLGSKGVFFRQKLSRPDISRRNAIHPNAASAQFNRKAADQTDHPGLG